jgi:hypothetical protein
MEGKDNTYHQIKEVLNEFASSNNDNHRYRNERNRRNDSWERAKVILIIKSRRFQMSRQCPECENGILKIIGTGSYGDTIECECSECSEFFELEPDGFDEGGMEWVEAMMMMEWFSNDGGCNTHHQTKGWLNI